MHVSVALQAAEVRVHQVDCFNHLRNLFLEHGATKAAVYIKESLRDQLEQIPKPYRIETTGMAPVRAVYKQFSNGGEYAKGKGAKEYWPWFLKNHPQAFVMPLQRADGGRQDLEVEGSLALFINRPFYDSFLDTLLSNCNHANPLEDNLWITLTSHEMVALFRALAVVALSPCRWSFAIWPAARTFSSSGLPSAWR